MTITNTDVAAYVATAAAIGSVCATLYAAFIAKAAADAWKWNLRQQRVDEAIASINTCAGMVGRCVSLRTNASGPVAAIEEVWASWRTYRTATTS